MKNALLITLLFIGSIGFSQSPELFNYQGIARNSIGEIMGDQPIGLQLTILQTSATGTVVYQETHSLTTNSFGLFTLQIGAGTIVSGSMSTIDWGADAYFLEVEMDASGGTAYTSMGTSQFISVPYALHAGTVENDNVDDADSDPTNEYNTAVTLSGTDLEVTDGGGTITTDLSSLQDGVDDADNDPTNEYNTAVALSGTNLQVTDGGGTIITDLSSLQDGVDDADNDPTNEYNTAVALSGTNLQVTDGGGTITTDLSSLQDGVDDADNDPTNELQDISLSGSDLTLSSGSTVDLSGVAASDDDWTVSGSNQYSAVSGNVGIGTTTPVRKLHVSSNDFETMRITRTGAGGAHIEYENTTSDVGTFGISEFGNMFIKTPSITDNTAFNLNDNGYLGIGTASPTGQFEVYNPTTFVTGKLTSETSSVALSMQRGTASDDNQVRFTTNGVTNHWMIGLDSQPTTTDEDFTIKYGLNNDIDPDFVIKQSGLIGIGTITPTARLHIEDNSTDYTKLRVDADGTPDLIQFKIQNTAASAGIDFGYVNNFPSYGDANETYIRASGNTAGLNILSTNSTGNGHISFYTSSDATGPSTMILDPFDNVGIGTETPVGKLDVRGNTWIQNESAHTNLILDDDGDGYYCDMGWYDEGVPRWIMRSTSVAETGGETGSNFEWLRRDDAGGIAGVVMWVRRSNGQVGMETVAPTALLSVNGTANKPGGGSWAVFSDSRLKKNVKPYTDGLSTLLQIQTKTFQYNGLAGIQDTEKEYVGIIAQDIQEIAPYMVREVHYDNQDTGEEGDYLEFDPSAMDFMIVNAIKELNEKIEALENQSQELEAENEELKEELEALKSTNQKNGNQLSSTNK